MYWLLQESKLVGDFKKKKKGSVYVADGFRIII